MQQPSIDADLADKALFVAVEALRRTVADVPQAIADNAARSLADVLSRSAASPYSMGAKTRAGASAADPDFSADAFAGRGGKGGKGKGGDDRDAPGFVGRRAGAAASAPGDAIGMILAKFGAIVGPLAVFGQVLNSNVAGFSVLSKVVGVLAATIGPLLLPVVALVGGALLELSDRLWNEIAPALEGFYTLVVDTLVPALELMIDAFVFAAETIKGAKELTEDVDPDAVKKAEAHAAEMAARPGGGGFGGAATALGFGKAKDAKDFDDGKAFLESLGLDLSGAGGGGGRPAPDAERLAREAGRTGDASRVAAAPEGVKGKTLEFLKEMRMSFAPRASYSDLGSVGRNATMAAMNQSPFEAKMLERMDKAISTLEKVLRAGEPPPAPAIPAPR